MVELTDEAKAVIEEAVQTALANARQAQAHHPVKAGEEILKALGAAQALCKTNQHLEAFARMKDALTYAEQANEEEVYTYKERGR